MNRVPAEIREQALYMLVEGSPMRGVSRATGMSRDAVNNLLVTSGRVAYAMHDKLVRDVEVSNVQCDELVTFCFSHKPSKKCHDWSGELWNWTAIDRDSKLLISWTTGGRRKDEGIHLMQDLKDRIKGKVKLTTDGFPVYPEAVSEVGFSRKDTEYVRLVKVFTGTVDNPADPDAYKKSVMDVVMGDPDIAEFGTAFVERHNLTLRQGMRRLMRRTLGHSKKRLHHEYMLALFIMYYNWVRPHMTLTERAGGVPTTPAMASGLADRRFSFREFIAACDHLTRPKPRKPYGPHMTPNKRRKSVAYRPPPSRVPKPDGLSSRNSEVVMVIHNDSGRISVEYPSDA